MKILSINNTIRQNNYQNINKPSSAYLSCACPVKENQISFSSLADAMLKLQARTLEKEVQQAFREASKTKTDSALIQSKASKLKTESLIGIADGMVLLKDVRKIYDKASKNGFLNVEDKFSGQLVREFYDGDDGQFIMEEYDASGKTTRKTIFDKNVTLIIKRSETTDKNDSYAFDTSSSELLEYSKGFKIIKDGYFADEHFSYCDNELVSYNRGYRLHSEEKETAKEHYLYVQNKLLKYCSNWESIKDQSEKADECFNFKNGKLTSISIGLIDIFNKSKSAIEEFLFNSEGDLTTYLCKVFKSRKQDETSTIEKMFKFSDFGLDKIYCNLSRKMKDNKTHAHKMFKCVDDEIRGCAFDYELDKDGVEKYRSYIKIA